MNTAEKIASVYLRLNGFLQLPLFTVFDGNFHNHLDLIGVRMAGSQETSKGFAFPLDEELFAEIGKLVASPKDTLLKLICEVRTNPRKDQITTGQFDYVKRFLGGGMIIQAIFYESDAKPQIREQQVHVGVKHAIVWVLSRIKAMQDQKMQLTKDGSWYLSDEWLADILVLRRCDVFKFK